VFDGDAASHAQEFVQKTLALRKTEVWPAQVEVATSRFVVDRVAEEFFIAVGLKAVVHRHSP
jgi:hypothetical protein